MAWDRPPRLSWMNTDTRMARYSAHLPLNGIGERGQRLIRNARVALIGLGGLGCPAAQYLVSSGIGKLTLCDFDTVNLNNLSRQILYRDGDIGQLKVEAATNALHRLNPDTRLESLATRMTDAEMQTLFTGCDLVIDTSDNYGTRLAVNRSCLELGIPWVMASCIRMEGQLMLMRPGQPGQACYRCAYGKAPDTLEDCPGAGVFAPVAGIIGTSAAHFGLACIAGLKVPQGLHVLDAYNWQWRSLRISKKPDCRDCS